MQTLLLIICLLLITTILAVFVFAYRNDKRLRNPEYYEAFEQRLISAARKRVQDEIRIHDLEIERKANE
jgi:hypothetical protein